MKIVILSDWLNFEGAKMKKVKVLKYGIIHYIAQCRDCEWETAMTMRDKDRTGRVRSSVRRHVLATGHNVTIESGKSTHYSLATEKI